jgi:hypothetical protein
MAEVLVDWFASSLMLALGTVRDTEPTVAGSIILLSPLGMALVAEMVFHVPGLVVSNTSRPRKRLLPFKVAVCP